MQNEEGKMMDLYIPRKCSATNRLITAKDHASVQINIGHLDESGLYTGQFTTFALSGFIRAQRHQNQIHDMCPSCHGKQYNGPSRESATVQGDADGALDRLWQKKKVEVRQQ